MENHNGTKLRNHDRGADATLKGVIISAVPISMSMDDIVKEHVKGDRVVEA
jgi:hypothetical protein